MVWDKLNAESVVLLHEYIHRDVHDTHELYVIDDAQLMSDDRKRHRWRFASSRAVYHGSVFGVMKFCLVYSLPHF